MFLMTKTRKDTRLIDFDESDHELVLAELNSITLNHVMARSKNNLKKTRSAILQLSKGDLNELGYLVDVAKVDFRDVIYWASLENKKKKT